MSLDDLIQRPAVPPVPPRHEARGTEKSPANQASAPGAPGAPDITRGTDSSLADTLAHACTGLALVPETLRAELSDEDVADIEAGRIPPETIRAYAELVAQRQGRATGEPTTEPWTAEEIDEAATERQAIIEESTGREAEAIARAARAFYAHIFGEAQRTGCCRAPLGSYCETGARLRAEYEAAASDGVPFPEMPTAYRQLTDEDTTT